MSQTDYTSYMFDAPDDDLQKVARQLDSLQSYIEDVEKTLLATPKLDPYYTNSYNRDRIKKFIGEEVFPKSDKARDVVASLRRSNLLDYSSYSFKCVKYVRMGKRGFRSLEHRFYKLLKITHKMILSVDASNWRKYASLMKSIQPNKTKLKFLEKELERDKLYTRQKEAEANQKEAEAKKAEAQATLLTTQANLQIGIARAEEAKALQQTNLIQLEQISVARQAIADAKEATFAAIQAQNLAEATKQANIAKDKAKEIENIIEIKLDDYIHSEYKNVLNDVKCGISPMLVGPAGSGKSTILQQIAIALQLPYYPMSVNGQTSEYSIIGYKNANGEYIRSAFRDAYEKGGLFSFEEIDAGNPNVLTVINNALSQDYYMFPDATIQKHKKFILAASANTFGRGANMQYIGRNPLDAATLDRFAMTYIDYDEELEKSIGPVPEWTDYVHAIRHIIQEFGMPIVVSMRAVIFGGRLIKSGTDEDTVLQKLVWRGCKTEDIEKIKKHIKQVSPKTR